MLSRFFINRPIFAWVLAIMTMLIGIGAVLTLPIAQYPDVAPPTIQVTASYPGANAESVESSVTQVIEQQLTGLDGLLYFSSTSSANGTVTISVTFAKGTNPDTAQVQVQNKVQQAVPRLPSQVQAQGIVVTKASSDFLLVVSIFDESNRDSPIDVTDYLVSHFQDTLARISGVGQTQVFGSQYAMRIWLDPYKLSAVQLMPSDITTAVQSQNIDVSAGQIGALPSRPGQELNAVVTAQSRLQTPDQFRAIVVKTRTDGSVVHLSDVARVELGSETYGFSVRYNGHPASGMAFQLAPGADALKTAAAVKAKAAELAKSMPSGYKLTFPRDSTDFIRLSVDEVVKTLLEAVVLVVIVMFVFLQSWRATLVPAIAVPVVLLGTFGVLAAFGYSINTLTLFGMVLAIGLLVDDAIVVVENVERIMDEEGLDPRAATEKSMDEIGSALIGIAVVLSAVLLPMAFFGGTTGVIYRQFSVTIVSAMALSVATALILTPALTANLLKPKKKAADEGNGYGARFNRWFGRQTERYVGSVDKMVSRRWLFLLVYAGILAVLAVLFVRLPTSFLPTEDQGNLIVQYTLPPGATDERTAAVGKRVGKFFAGEKDVQGFFAVDGFSFSGQGQSVGLGFIVLKPFDERKGAQHSAPAISGRAMGDFATIRDAQVFALAPPPIQGLGQSNGFTMELLNSSNLSRTDFAALRDKLLGAAAADPALMAVRPSSLAEQPQLHIDIDEEKLAVLGLTQADVNSTLAGAWGSTYINDFVDRGRVKRVFMQGDAPYRSIPSDLDNWFVRSSSTGQMVPFSAFATLGWSKGPVTLTRFNGTSSYEFQGSASPGHSSGSAMQEMVKLAQQVAPGTTVAWSSLSYEENVSSGQAPLLYGISILVVFLALAALYESWSVPFAVILVVPLGLIGAVAAVTLRGLENNIYFQVGLLTTMGLAAKNAILIVEFAEQAHRSGKNALDAALEAARIRLRPIMMTSLAFIAGVLPLAIATGAGANSRIDIGTAVVGGMLTATALAIFFVPLFFVLVTRISGHDAPEGEGEAQRHPEPQPA